MIKQEKKLLSAFVLTFAIFVVFTVLVVTVDVSPIGPQNSSVGFSHVNGFFRDLINQNSFWYTLTEGMGTVALLWVLLWALAGLLQWIGRKSLFKIDPSLLAFGLIVLVVLMCYAFFEVFVINYRPILGEEGLEASYPSSHTMLAVCVSSCSVNLVRCILSRGVVQKAALLICRVFIVLMPVGRMLSGVHWFTDIIGSLLLSAAIYLLFLFCESLFKRLSMK